MSTGSACSKNNDRRDGPEFPAHASPKLGDAQIGRGQQTVTMRPERLIS